MKANILLNTTDRKKSNFFPVIVNVSHKGKRMRKQIGISIPEDWDDVKKFPLPTHPEFDDLYVRIAEIKAKSITSKFTSINDVKIALAYLLKEGESKNKIDFIKFSRYQIKKLRQSNRNGSAFVYDKIIDDFEHFKPTCDFGEITLVLMERYKEYCKDKGSKNSSIKTYIAGIRRMYNLCCRLNGIPNERPFEGIGRDLYHNKRRGKNIYISKSTVKKLENLKLSSNSQQRAIDLMLLQFYLGGQYLKDIYYLKVNQIYNGRAFIKRLKLGDKAEEFDVKIFKKAQKIIDRYALKDNVYVFPWSKGDKEYHKFRQSHYYTLRRVFKENQIETLPKNAAVVTRTPRHTFATIGKFKGIDVDIIRELMGHERNDMDTVYKDKFPQKVKDKAHWEIIKT
ncbi:tyrosine-type recombinase/integrase [Aquimarina algiphila]|uniref:Site-specific integrase n=1 Tax=Aquimarina algiphila TaxID=2047982 RepID=A0A554VDD2_9FLAO|nr:phage integrase SAM-like domain-containing protein [Aquimarina algiphila]TSE04863.1 site-specific integrase [Aquimarina algiphila]